MAAAHHYFVRNTTAKGRIGGSSTVDFTATHSSTNLAFFDGSGFNNYSAVWTTCSSQP